MYVARTRLFQCLNQPKLLKLSSITNNQPKLKETDLMTDLSPNWVNL